MGFIVNPKEDQLSSWFKCTEKMAEYYMKTLPIIWIDDLNIYYFVKTEKWEKVHSERPTWVKVLEAFKSFSF